MFQVSFTVQSIGEIRSLLSQDIWQIGPSYSDLVNGQGFMISGVVNQEGVETLKAILKAKDDSRSIFCHAVSQVILD